MVNENDLGEILAQELERIKECGERINLAEIERRTGISRAVLRRWQSNGYVIQPSRKGWRSGTSKLDDVSETVDALLRKGVANSSVILERIRELGYDGGISILKDYIRRHRDLVPAPRHIVASTGNRGRRYTTGRGDCYQMDWGFVNVVDVAGNGWRCACFVMVCHHCGFRYVEFFPNARQENLFIGMIHAFSVMGIPKRVLTDNMKSVTLGRDAAGNVIYNHDYDAFQHLLGFLLTILRLDPLSCQKLADADSQLPAQIFKDVDIWERLSGFPFRDGPVSYIQSTAKLLLCQFFLFPAFRDESPGFFQINHRYTLL